MKKFEGIVFYIFLFCLIFGLSYAWATVDPDFWARLLQGFAFLETGHILFQDPFSYVPRHEWFDHEWGAGVIFAVFQNLFGYMGQYLLKTILMFLIMVFIIKIIRLQGLKNTKLYNFLFFFFILYSLESSLLSGIRCHFFTFLFFTIFLYILEEVRINGKNKLLFLLPVIMVFWANIHGGCVSGIGLLLIYAVGEFLNKKPCKKYLYSAAVSFLVFFINPYGIDYVKFIIHATTMKRPLIVEWQNIFQKEFLQLLKAKIFACLFLGVFFASLFKNFKNRDNINYTKILTLFTTAFLAFSHVKHFPFFIITATALLYDDFFFFFNAVIKKIREFLHLNSETFIKRFVITKEIIVYLLVIAEIFALIKIHDNRVHNFLYTRYPVKIVEFLKINNLKGTILNKFGVGSYLSYKLYPQNLIYMDGRYEEVYFDETFLYNWHFFNYVNDNNIRWNSVFEAYGYPDFIVFDIEDNIYDYINELKNYLPLYNDGFNFLYIRKDLLKSKYYLPNNNEKHYIKTYFDRMVNFRKK